ncbi:hypothetical protein [Cellulophaga tyrosinoxydans]|uniref:Uncharacterized protein n=1 Tax=Cellulophaga tyrosinoxydans TaxID=504486 RepID=A0A1W1YC05_9FLAO|nr:hypothetical protein [Cellulophaga tyrosinoxydans]SMC33702.1 hypothetical protein SAMN05660703_0274 [Cellulophaga tyrosinoxydans]
MREYYLNSIDYEYYPPEFIQYSIKNLVNNKTFFESDEQASFYKPYLFAHYLGKIKNDIQLNNTIDLYKSGGWLKKEKIATQYLIENVLYKLIYSKEDCTKIRAIVYSGMMEYEILIKTYKSIIKRDIPEFKFEVKDKVVIVNSDELLHFIGIESRNTFLNQLDRKNNYQEKIYQIENLISVLARIDYQNGTSFFDKEKLNLTYLKQNITRSIQTENIHPFKIIGAKENFLKYTALHIIDAYKDYSFLYNMMLNKSLIEKIGHKQFIKWLHKNDYIKEKDYEVLISKEQLISLKNSRSEQRLNNFNNIFFPSN